MLDDPLDLDLERLYARYLVTCRMSGVEPVPAQTRGRLDRGVDRRAYGVPGTDDALAREPAFDPVRPADILESCLSTWGKLTLARNLLPGHHGATAITYHLNSPRSSKLRRAALHPPARWGVAGRVGLTIPLSTCGIQTFTRPKLWQLRGA